MSRCYSLIESVTPKLTYRRLRVVSEMRHQRFDFDVAIRRGHHMHGQRGMRVIAEVEDRLLLRRLSNVCQDGEHFRFGIFRRWFDHLGTLRLRWRQELCHASDVRFHIDSVNVAFVLSQMVSLNEAVAADIAFIPFASMSSHMRLEIVTLRETLDTMWTLVRSLPGVHSSVHQQIVGTLETLAAYRAEVRLFTRMIPLVDR